LTDKPEVYGLPRDPKLPSRNLFLSSTFSALGAVVLGIFGLVGLRKRRMDEIAESTRGNTPPQGRSDV
jgi:formate dehydrogenase iron-sulfur subunit